MPQRNVLKRCRFVIHVRAVVTDVFKRILDGSFFTSEKGIYPNLPGMVVGKVGKQPLGQSNGSTACFCFCFYPGFRKNVIVTCKIVSVCVLNGFYLEHLLVWILICAVLE